MREGWTSKKLDEVTVPSGTIDPRKEPEAIFQYVDVSSVSNQTFEIIETSALLGKDAPSRARRLIRSGDIVFATIRPTLQRIAVVPKELDGQVCSTGYFVFRAKPELDNRFLFHYLFTNEFSGAMEALQSGASYPAVNDTQVRQQRISFPPLPEQQRIVAILDEAFKGIATATSNTEKNLKNARDLYRSSLRACFDQKNAKQAWMTYREEDTENYSLTDKSRKGEHKSVTSTTRGRAETDRLIEGDLSLSVGMPRTAPRPSWKWSKLTDLARLESGHTPSRKHPEYWNGDIPWIGIKDAKLHHGETISHTLQYTNQQGIDNSAARLLPVNTVCLSRTASVGYVVVTGTEMATSQDFVNWVCSPYLDPHFLKYLLIAEGDGFYKYSSGSVHQTIYFPEVKAFCICHPEIAVQRRIVVYLDNIRKESQRLESIYQQKLTALSELKQSLLQKAFSGELTAEFASTIKEEALA